MSERIAIFPIDSDNSFILDNSDKFEQYELIYGIVPKGWEINQDEIKNKQLLCYEQDFIESEKANNIDTLVLCESKYVTDYTIYESFTTFARNKGINIVYFNNINDNVKKIIENDSKCIGYDEASLNDFIDVKNLVKPVIMVVGYGENCEKLQIQLSLYDFFKDENYKPCLIASNLLGKLMGFHTLPDFIFQHQYDFTTIVRGLGHYIKQIETQEDPDVIIIGVPGAPAKFNKYLDNYYGYIPFLVTSAVKPDIGILSLYCGEYKEEHFDELQKIYYYRFGIQTNYFHLSSKVSNYNLEQKKLEYYTIDKTFVIDKFMKSVTSVPIFHVNDNLSKQKVYTEIMDELKNNIEIM